MSEMKSMPKFNKAQKQAVEHNKGPMMVLAGPGAGKTLVITYRTKTLIEKYGVEPGKILVITFTKAAAEEMKVRFQNIMDGKYVPVRFGTFHAVFFSILKHAYHYTASNIIRESEKKRILLEIVENMELDIEDLNEFIQDMENEISLVKGEMLSLEHYFPMNCAKDIFQKVYTRYNQALQRRKLIDFDDMLVYCYELLTQRPDILKMWQQQFQYILIDEFQDINKVQYDIIRLLARPNNNLFIVGDDDQSIYRFRGAKPEIMLQFEEVYPSAKKVLLDVNYRSTACIVETASMVIAHNKTRFPKNIRTDNERGQEVAIREFEDLKQQNEKIIEKVREYQKQGMPLSQIAVLFRTNMQPRALIGKFMEYNIPFCVREQIPNIYEHWIAKDIIAYIKLAQGKRDRSLFLKVANRPKRYLSRQIFDTQEISFERLRLFFEDKKWMQERLEQFEDDLLALSHMTPYAAINYIRKAIGYDEFLEEYAQFRHIKVEELYEILDELSDLAKPFQNYKEWFENMEQYALELEKQVKKKKDVQQEDAVAFVTMHGSKGLEYDIVFIVDVNEGIIPHQKAVLEEDIEEERRMFYVAMTRAKKELYIYFAKERFSKEFTMSRFLAELLDNTDID
ncbi:superfamily I DNA and RNA helicases [Clostridium sp. CAG:411]|nr:ATP-dependent helicase [Lachnospiraceae bacterium]CDE42817.1 superfamily I DNA and RNA helicases [Clostridium sp. CAG:411]